MTFLAGFSPLEIAVLACAIVALVAMLWRDEDRDFSPTIEEDVDQ